MKKEIRVLNYIHATITKYLEEAKRTNTNFEREIGVELYILKMIIPDIDKKIVDEFKSINIKIACASIYQNDILTISFMNTYVYEEGVSFDNGFMKCGELHHSVCTAFSTRNPIQNDFLDHIKSIEEKLLLEDKIEQRIQLQQYKNKYKL